MTINKADAKMQIAGKLQVTTRLLEKSVSAKD